MARVVFDCNVFLQAVLNHGPSFHCMELVESGIADLLISTQVLQEVSEVLARPRLIRQHPQLTPTRVAAFLSLLTRRAQLIENVPNQITFDRDPKDAPYINLVIAGGADYLVSRDRDLLEIWMDHAAQAAEIRGLCPDLKIMEPQDFLLKMSDRKK